jgi:hypothetical protein
MLNSPLFDIKQLLSFFMPATSLFFPCLKNLSLKSHINKQSDMVDSSNQQEPFVFCKILHLVNEVL